jgi:broad specificity phosphatase PhoE
VLLKNFVLIILIFFYSLSSNGNSNIIEALKKNNKLIFIRHALAPGNGDPDNFDIFDCSTQRNLNSVGREQSIELGKFFDTNNISIDLVLSSEWCRCKETANLAFQKFETFDALNSFYDPKFYKNKEPQLDKLINFINNLDNEGNIVFVTHYVVIAAIFGQAVTSGEILIADRNLNVVGRIKDY